jgi:HK97 gp10 family phage protein
MRHTPVNQRAVQRLRTHPVVGQRLTREADEWVERAQEAAPKRTGAGAASIHKEPIEDDGGVVGYSISWDREHDYMRFHELGTEAMPARPFLRPAAPTQ